VQKLSADNAAESLPQHPVVQKWWAFMSDISETNHGNSPVCVTLPEMFHAD